MREEFNIEQLKKLIVKKYKEKGFNQVEFANHLGLTKQNFHKWLNAPHSNMKFLFNILIDLDINLGDLQNCIEEYKISTLKEVVEKQ